MEFVVVVASSHFLPSDTLLGLLSPENVRTTELTDVPKPGTPCFFLSRRKTREDANGPPRHMNVKEESFHRPLKVP